MKLFDREYLTFLNDATNLVPLLKFLYIINIPLAKALIKLKISPNSISTISNILAILAFISLIFFEMPLIFPIFWILSLFFDIADGIVARKTLLSSANGSFYDHFSDQVKIFLLFLCLGVKYENYYFWILVFSANGLFLLLGYVNQLLSLRRYIIRVRLKSTTSKLIIKENKRSFLKKIISKNTKFKNIILGFYSSIFAMYGNCMLIFLPISFGLEYAVLSVILFKLITLKSIIHIIIEIVSINKILFKNKISWK